MTWDIRRMSYILTVLVLVLTVGLLGCASQTAQTPAPEDAKAAVEPLITKIEAKTEGGKVKIAILANQPIRYKAIYKENNPLRLVVDLQGFQFLGVPRTIEVKQGAVDSIEAEALDEGVRKRARININLQQVVVYESSNLGQILLVELDMPAAAAPSAGAGKESAASVPPLTESHQMMAEQTTNPEPPAEKTPAENKADKLSEKAVTPGKEATPEAPKEKGEAPKPAVPGGPVVISSFDIKNAAAAATVTIAADAPIATYESFELPNPPRLVVDIPDATHAAPKQVAVKETGVVTRLRSSQYKDAPKKVVRVVVDLKNAIPYKIETVNNQLVVNFGEAIAAAPAGAPPAEGAKPGTVRDIIKIDFKPADNKSLVTVVASGTGELKYNVNRIQEPPSIVLDIMDAKLMASARKTLDLRTLPSAIAQIRAVQHQKEPQNVVRIVMDLKGTADFQVMPAAKGLVVEVAQAAAIPPPPAPVAVAPKPEAPAAGGPPAVIPGPVGPPLVSMDFKDADIGNILRLLAEVGHVNIVVSEDVKAKVTVRLENVQWEKALDVILKANNLAYVKEDAVIRVARAETLKREEEDKLKARTLRDDLIPLVTKTQNLNYAKAADMAKSLSKALTKRGEIQIDERTNTLIIKDIPDRVEEIIKLALKLDTRTPQVMIEARIVEVTTPDFEREIGLQWGFQFNDRYKMTEKNKTIGFPRSVSGSGNSVGASGPDQVTPFLVNVPVSTIAGNAHPALGAALTLSRAIGLDTAQLDIRIQAHERIGDLKVISSPKVSVLDNVEAEVQSGASIPIQVVEQGEVSTKYIDANIDLKVTPRITVDNNIRLKVSAKKNEPDFTRTVNGNPLINKREATTEVLVRDGETIVIGGVFKGTENKSEIRVPWLGQVPVLGWFFKDQYQQIQNQELLIFITPQILKGV